MDKYNKHTFSTALVLEIQASLYLTPSDAIFVSKFWPFSEAHKLLKIKPAKFIFFVCDTTQLKTNFENHKRY